MPVLWSGLHLRSRPISISFLFLCFILFVNASSLNSAVPLSSESTPAQTKSGSSPPRTLSSSRSSPSVLSSTISTSASIAASSSSEPPPPSEPPALSMPAAAPLSSQSAAPLSTKPVATKPDAPPIDQPIPAAPTNNTMPASSAPPAHVSSTSRESSASHPIASTKADPVSSAHPSGTPPPPTTPPKVPAPDPSPSSNHASSAQAPSSAHVEPSIHTTSTVTSITVVHAPASIQTSTITTQAGTTFSSPVAVTSVNAAGSQVIITPPLVTVLSTSTEPDGLPATVTHVIANPTGFGSNGRAVVNDTGFFHKQGAVAGVFVVVGIAVAAIIAGLIVCIRNQRRRNRRRRWLAGMQQQRLSFARSPDPFQDPTEPMVQNLGPMMQQSIHTVSDNARWDGHSNSHLVPDEPASSEYRPNFSGHGNNFLLYPDPYPMPFHPNNMVQPQQKQYEMQNVDLGHPMEAPNRSHFRHSMAPSTPSIYPATLPPDDDEKHETEDKISKPTKRELTHLPAIAVPPRPPRSHLRESAKNLEYTPLTPPESVVSNHSKPPSPISPVTESQPQEVLTRRTLLDVRHRTNNP